MIRLRAHHLGKIAYYYQSPELFDLSDAEYVAMRRQELRESEHYPEDFYSDKAILGIRSAIRTLLENPDQEFEYVEGIDSLCAGCNHQHECSEPGHVYHDVANREDQRVAGDLPEMKPGEKYTANYVLELYGSKGWLDK